MAADEQATVRNAAGLPLYVSLFFRHEYRIVKVTHIGSRTRSEDQFLYPKVQSTLVPPHYVCSGDGTGLGAKPLSLGDFFDFSKKKTI